MELLEKRVKSRFSHRQIYLYSPSSFGDFSAVTKNVLKLSQSHSIGDPKHLDYINDFNNAVEVNYPLLKNPPQFNPFLTLCSRRLCLRIRRSLP